jgi:hypothetical protein
MTQTANKMKASYFVSIAMATGLLFLVSCKKDSHLTAQEKATAMLTSGTWQSPVVTVDGVDYSDVYKDFSIKFDKTTYTTTSGAPVWKASGTWVFLNEEATLMKLNNDREVEINSIDDDFLELSFQWNEDTFEPGRVSSVKGKQKFKLKKKR